jgi:hypothetical protein
VELFSSPFHRPYKALDRPIVSFLNLRREKAGRKFLVFPMISYAIAADILAAAGFVSAVASFFIGSFFAFHAYHLTSKVMPSLAAITLVFNSLLN